ncbi:hypothetical protein [Dyadobacter sp. 676]|uniref:DUF4595 domain-containing protein n=1 Tax=Dyadobacter sp. 676 TaxID=3088362 RepID=A0AAU8FKQ0_9BACT
MPQPNVYPTFIAKYTWNNVDYLLSWYQYDTDNPIRYFLRMEPYAKFSYTIHAEEQSDLPRPVTGFLEREKLNLSTAQISVNERNEKQYFVNAATASGTNYQFTFDNAGKLINTVYQAEAFYYNVEEYPEQIRTFIKNAPAFSAMKLIQGYKFSNVLGTGYVMNMQATNENCWLNFDQDGKFVNMTYQTAIYR